LAAVREGKIRRLVINLPPRHLSLLASVAFPAWCLGHEPSAQILCVSYAQDLADKLSRDCRHIVASGWYQQIFPGTRLSPPRAAVPEFDTTAQGCRLATSVGGVLTGRGADLIIIDDPLKPEEALSQAQRQAANDWYDHTLYSRLNDKLEGAIVLIMHRLHEDDLTAHVLAQEEWEAVRLPALAEADEALCADPALGPQCFTRRRGEALQPEREPPAMLAHIRRTIGEYNFAGQYQQAPAPLGGGLVKAVWFPRYRLDEVPPRLERVLQSWDTANKASELSDFSVCTSWGCGWQKPLSDRRAAAHGIPGIEAGGARAIRALRPRRRADRGQGLGHAADPGIACRRRPRRHPLPAAERQGHAPARADRDDRERLCAPARGGAVARAIRRRADDVSERQARQPRRLDRASGSLGQGRRPRARGPLRSLQSARRRAS